MLAWYWNWPVRPRFPQIVLQAIGEAAELQLLLQDVDGPGPEGWLSRDRVPSAHDPEMAMQTLRRT